MDPRSLPARCAEHGLAPGPDGQCVLCRRAASGSAPGGFRERVIVAAAIGLGLAVAVAVARRSLPAAASSPPPAVAEPITAAESVPTVEPPVDRAAARAEVAPARSPVEANPRVPASVGDASAASARAEELRARSQADIEKRRELGAAMHRVPITLYSTAWCSACARAKAWLVANRYGYRELDVEHDETARRTHRELNPRGSVPTIDVDGDVMVGFSASSLESRIRQAAERRAF